MTKVMILTMPRVCGYGFNPITLYHCYGADRQLAAVVYEVHNTFGEAHNYVHLASGNTSPRAHVAPKQLYVSPFFGVDGFYHFRLKPLVEKLALTIQYNAPDGQKNLIASLSAQRRTLNFYNLMRVFFRIPFVTLKVIGAIHFEAFRLWLRGVPVFSKPAPPENDYAHATSGPDQETRG